MQGNNVEDEISNGSLNYPPGFTPIEEGDKKFDKVDKLNGKEQTKWRRKENSVRVLAGSEDRHTFGVGDDEQFFPGDLKFGVMARKIPESYILYCKYSPLVIQL
ncbi:hypothetical protein Tco_0754404 [Tanacetum coccineum]